jgi:hypothetical protein
VKKINESHQDGKKGKIQAYWKNISKSRRIIISLIVADIVLILILILSPESTLIQIIHNEGYKQLWQISLAVIGGGFITLAFAELKREQESRDKEIKLEQEIREARREYLRIFFSQALSAYNKAKKCRRMLRAKTIHGKDGVKYFQLNEFAQLMTELEDCQLEFESLKRQIPLAESTFKDMPLIEKKFDPLEKYLNRFLKKFEDGNYFKGDTIPLSELDVNILEFLKHYETEEEKKRALFFVEFSDSFSSIEKTLIKEISK